MTLLRQIRHMSRRSLALAATLALLALVTTPRPATSQESVFTEFHTWTDLATIYKFNDRFRYDGDYGLRGLLTDANWTLLYLRPSVRYVVRPWLGLHGGAALFYNFFGDGDDLPELRPWVGLRFVGPRPGGFTISNYFRLELRAFYLKEQSDWDAILRGRWQLQVVTPRFAIASARDFYFIVSAELFGDITSTADGSFGDRYRFNFGLGKQVSPSLRIDLNYVFHTIRVTAADDSFDFDDHVARLRFFYSLN